MTDAKELTLFGRAMDLRIYMDGYQHFTGDVCIFRVGVFGARDRFSNEIRMLCGLNSRTEYAGDVHPSGPFATKELARDAAERELIKLRDALAKATGCMVVHQDAPEWRY